MDQQQEEYKVNLENWCKKIQKIKKQFKISSIFWAENKVDVFVKRFFTFFNRNFIVKFEKVKVKWVILKILFLSKLIVIIDQILMNIKNIN